MAKTRTFSGETFTRGYSADSKRDATSYAAKFRKNRQKGPGRRIAGKARVVQIDGLWYVYTRG